MMRADQVIARDLAKKTGIVPYQDEIPAEKEIGFADIYREPDPDEFKLPETFVMFERVAVLPPQVMGEEAAMRACRYDVFVYGITRNAVRDVCDCLMTTGAVEYDLDGPGMRIGTKSFPRTGKRFKAKVSATADPNISS